MKLRKRVLGIILVLSLAFSACACTKQEVAVCEHEYVAATRTLENGVTEVVLTCSKCGEIASASVDLPEKEVVKEVEVEKEVVKTVVKTVEKEVVKEVEVPVYLTDEERELAENYELLYYYAVTYGKVDAIKDYVVENYYEDVDEDALLEGLCTGLIDALGDEYSEYIPATETDSYIETSLKVYSGIGVTIQENDDKDGVIQSVSKNSPAETAGLMAGDLFVEVNGQNVRGIGVSDIANLVRGEEGTPVVIKVLRGEEEITVLAWRGQIAEETVDYGYFTSGVGYIYISTINSGTPDSVNEALEYFEENGIDRFVLDLRDNGGGDVSAAQSLADILMDEGLLAYTVDGNGNREDMKTSAGRTSMKYVILVNGNTASACELICAGVQDNGEGKIVGTKTYGKGVVQTMAYLSDGSAVKLTMYQYFSPNGNTINGVGITPDVIIEYDDEAVDENGEPFDSQLNSAIEVLLSIK